MSCKFCAWLSRRLGIEPEARCAEIWDKSDAWEREHSNESDLWFDESDQNRELIEQASAIRDTDPEGAFQLYLQAADAGSVWAMQMVAWHYDTGTYVVANFERAQEYHRRAISAGSWMATIYYAQLLAEHGHFDYCERLLEDGVRSDFIPAFFWLAWFRCKQSKSRKTCREIRPLLDYASEKGHPGAKRFLATLQVLGKYGLREMPAGLRMIRECMNEDDAEEASDPEKLGDFLAAGEQSTHPTVH